MRKVSNKGITVLFYTISFMILLIIMIVYISRTAKPKADNSKNNVVTTITTSETTTTTIETTTASSRITFTTTDTTAVTTSSTTSSHEIVTNDTVVNSYDEYYWVGDSRTVGLSSITNIDCTAKVGAGIELLRSNIYNITSLRGNNIIFNLGVNDLHNVNSYLEIYNNLPEEFLANNNVFVLSVNPCNCDYEYLNDDIEYFNETMKNGLRSDISFIDSYTYMIENGFYTSDGLHYINSTYSDVYNHVIEII